MVNMIRYDVVGNWDKLRVLLLGERDFDLWDFPLKSYRYDENLKNIIFEETGKILTFDKRQFEYSVTIPYSKINKNEINILSDMELVGDCDFCIDYKHMEDASAIFSFSSQTDAILFKLMID